MRRALLAVAALLIVRAAEAGTLTVTTPEGTTGIVTLHRWDAPDSDAPFGRIVVPGQVDLPDGSWGIAIGDNPYRFGPVAVTGAAAVQLSAFGVTVPRAAVAAPLGVFEESGGGLAATLAPPATTLLPPGRFTIRRDGGETTVPLTLAAGMLATEHWGALRFSGPLAGPVFLLAEDGIVQRLDDPSRPVALPSGSVRILTAPSARPQPVEVPSGAVLDVPAATLVVADMTPPGTPLRLADPATGESLAWWDAGMPVRLPLVATGGRVAVERAGDPLGTVDAGPDGAATIWLTPSGVLALPGLPDAVPVAPASEGPLLPGRPFEVTVLMPERVDLAVLLVPDPPAAPVALAPIPFAGGTGTAEIAIPAALAAGRYRIVVGATLSTGEVLTGRTAPLPVHVPIAAAPSGLALTGATLTSLHLAWAAPDPPAGVVGYNIYRNAVPRPVNGGVPVAGTAFDDIGLGAGRAVSYTVCGVDALGLEGPCSPPVEGRTLPPD